MKEIPVETSIQKMETGLKAADHRQKAKLFFELTKPRLSLLTVLTALIGFLAARPDSVFLGAIHVLIGTALSAGGAAVLNQVAERRADAKMNRTKTRPLVTGEIDPLPAAIWGIFLILAGIGHLLFWTNLFAGLLAAATVFLYVAVYTPLKKISTLSLEVGALAGALPPLIGWTAAENGISTLGWILFGILFAWQIPHFLAISWIYREDYAAAEFSMLTVVDKSGNRAGRHAFVFCTILLLITLLPFFLGYSSLFYFAVALSLGIHFLWKTWLFFRSSNRDESARRLFFISILYLPLLLLILMADRWLSG